MESNNEQTETTEKGSVHDVNSNKQSQYGGTFLPIEKIENFPTEILQTLFRGKHDFGLLNMSSVNPKFKSIAQKVFAERYTDKYFIIKAGSMHQKNLYFELFNVFGNNIKAIQVHSVRYIDNDHWIIELLNKYTSNLEKLCFKKCFFVNVDEFLSQHIKITHLSFRGGACEKTYRIQLPEYRNLTSLESVNFSHISKPSLEQVLSNNPQIECLTFSRCDHYFTLSDLMVLVVKHLKHLKLLNILDCFEYDYAPVMSLDRFVDGIQSLEAFGATILYARHTGLLRRVGTNCKNIKSIELYMCGGYPNRAFIELISTFDTIETLSLKACSYQEHIESIIENLPNLKSVSISNMSHRTNAQILSILSKSKLEKLSIESDGFSYTRDNDESIFKRNIEFHDKFIETIPNPHTRLEFVESDEVIGIITKNEIIWRNKRLHWVGYDPIHSQSSVQLLDLAMIPAGSNVKHKQPLNLILNYLDLDSLYSFGMANKECKQLVHNYIFQRCKQSSKKRAQHRSIERDKFYITDEFGMKYDGLRMFGKNIKYLEINLFNYGTVHELLTEIKKHCKHLTKLCFRTLHRIDPNIIILPQIRHFIFYGYGLSEDYIFHCELSALAENGSNLEIFESRTPIRLYSYKTKFLFKNLQKFKFKPYDDSQVEIAKDFFKNTNIEIIIDR